VSVHFQGNYFPQGKSDGSRQRAKYAGPTIPVGGGAKSAPAPEREGPFSVVLTIGVLTAAGLDLGIKAGSASKVQLGELN